jgi:hypothetical protein
MKDCFSILLTMVIVGISLFATVSAKEPDLAEAVFYVK